MTRVDVFCKAIAAATEQPETEIRELLETAHFLKGISPFEGELLDSEADSLLKTLTSKKGKRIITAWLLEGRLNAIADLTEASIQKTAH